MGILSRIVDRAIETRSGVATPEKWLVEWFNGGEANSAGITVTPENAEGLTAIACAITIYSSTIASLPLGLFERLEDGGKKPDPGHPLYTIIHDQPNSWQTSYEWREMMEGFRTARGTAYSEILHGNGRAVDALIPLNPDHVVPIGTTRDFAWKYTAPGEQPRTILRGDMFVLRGRSRNGVTGLDPFAEHVETIGQQLAAEQFAGRFYSNDASPGGVLEHPGALDDETKDYLSKTWHKAHGGAENKHKVAVLENGMKWQSVSLSPEVSQLLQTRKFGVTEVARIFNLPPHMLKDLERATFSNIEQSDLDLVRHSLRPKFVNWEQAIRRDLLTSEDKKTRFVEFNAEGLMRGDTAARKEWYSGMFGTASITPNQIRSKENMNPYPGGDKYYVPLNFMAVDDLPSKADIADRMAARLLGDHVPTEAPRVPTARELPAATEDRSLQTRRRLQRSHQRLFLDVSERLVKREVNAIKKALRRTLGQRNALADFEEWLVDFYETNHRQEIEKKMIGPVTAFAEVIAAEAASEIRGGDELSQADLEAFAREYTATAAGREATSSRRQLQSIIRNTDDGDVETLEEAIQERMTGWIDTRPTKVALRESVQGGSAFAKLAWTLVGVASLRWVANPGACPLCQDLDGKVVGIRQEFVSAGGTVDGGADTQSLVVEKGIQHPQLHGGCECQIAPA